MPRKPKAIAQVEEDVFKASQSKVKTWLACKRRYHYRYVEKLKRVKKGRPLQFGSLVHEMIEAHAKGEDPFEYLDKVELEKGKLFAAEVEMYGEIIADVGYIMEDYFSYWGGKDKNAMKTIEINGTLAEHEFEVKLEPGLILTGKIDMFGKTPDKLKWLVEHKTFNRRPSEEFRWLNVQSSVYLRVAEEHLGIECDGTMWDYIHSAPCKTPQILNSGVMSQKKISILPTALRQFCSDNKLKVKDYPSLMKHATDTVMPEYFFRIRNPMTSKVVNEIYSEFIDSIHDMRERHGKLKMRTIDKHCGWCDYAPLCKAAMLGHDTKFIIKREYTYGEETSKGPREEEVVG